MARRRAQWTKYQDRIDPSRLVFIDETWTKTNMAPLRGWAPRGERIKAKVPHGHWKTMTFLAALRHDRVEAPWLIDGPINGERFQGKWSLPLHRIHLPDYKPMMVKFAFEGIFHCTVITCVSPRAPHFRARRREAANQIVLAAFQTKTAIPQFACSKATIRSGGNCGRARKARPK